MMQGHCQGSQMWTGTEGDAACGKAAHNWQVKAQNAKSGVRR